MFGLYEPYNVLSITHAISSDLVLPLRSLRPFETFLSETSENIVLAHNRYDALTGRTTYNCKLYDVSLITVVIRTRSQADGEKVVVIYQQ